MATKITDEIGAFEIVGQLLEGFVTLAFQAWHMFGDKNLALIAATLTISWHVLSLIFE